MNCKNKEKFPISTIMFDQTYVKDNDGNILFKLNNYINQKQFGCDVGILDSEIIQESKKSSNKIIVIILSSISLAFILGITSFILYSFKEEELFCWEKKEVPHESPPPILKKFKSISNDLEKESKSSQKDVENKTDQQSISNYEDSKSNLNLN